jgi:hypothetical protein
MPWSRSKKLVIFLAKLVLKCMVWVAIFYNCSKNFFQILFLFHYNFFYMTEETQVEEKRIRVLSISRKTIQFVPLFFINFAILALWK